MYLLDTNICIYAMKGTYPAVGQRLFSIRPEKIFVSSVTVGELEYGAAKSRWGARTRDVMRSFLANYEILPFDAKDAVHFGRFRAALAASGTPIGAYDVMIAAQGFARSLTVVTHNIGEFSRIPGLKLEDWTMY
ncbi:MAG: type II toxin-antitoxin system VapC family toxin [Schwartzia sp.]|nr:type II toxin-antitoxin system VapC family toxin [Schwartzia sp. (in: firmicutes)]